MESPGFIMGSVIGIILLTIFIIWIATKMFKNIWLAVAGGFLITLLIYIETTGIDSLRIVGSLIGSVLGYFFFKDKINKEKNN